MLSSFNTLENENNTINRDDKIVTECTRILDVSSESYDKKIEKTPRIETIRKCFDIDRSSRA